MRTRGDRPWYRIKLLGPEDARGGTHISILVPPFQA
jgi:hypothetical protein